MDQISQIKNCIVVWDSRLKRYESVMRSKRQTVEAKRQEYERSVTEAEEAELSGKEQIKLLNEELIQKTASIQELKASLVSEKKIKQSILDKKQVSKDCHGDLEQAQDDFEKSKVDVSSALKKLEKYQLICSSLG